MPENHPIHSSVKALKKDRRFARLIKKHGFPDLEHGKNPFQALVRSIVHQQLSGKAAETIYNRFVSLFEKSRGFPSPDMVGKMPVHKLRSAGLSAQKALYIHDLAEKFSKGVIEHKKFHRMTSEEIIAHLTEVKGVGVWTVHMFLIFTLNRLDVLPTGDLGIRKGFQIVYKLSDLPDHKTMENLAKPWREHATVASWYLWRVADEAREARPKNVKDRP